MSVVSITGYKLDPDKKYDPDRHGSTQQRSDWKEMQMSEHGIPRGSSVRLETMPNRRVVFDGKVSKSLNLDLDPGYYTIAITNMHKKRKDLRVSYSYKFFHDITPEQWKKYQFMKATKVSIMYTSSGFRWRCQWSGCKAETTSRLGAYVHECEDHFGIDPIAASENMTQELAVKRDEISAKVQEQRGAERKAAMEGTPVSSLSPGRPRKAAV